MSALIHVLLVAASASAPSERLGDEVPGPCCPPAYCEPGPTPGVLVCVPGDEPWPMLCEPCDALDLLEREVDRAFQTTSDASGAIDPGHHALDGGGDRAGEDREDRDDATGPEPHEPEKEAPPDRPEPC